MEIERLELPYPGIEEEHRINLKKFYKELHICKFCGKEYGCDLTEEKIKRCPGVFCGK